MLSKKDKENLVYVRKQIVLAVRELDSIPISEFSPHDAKTRDYLARAHGHLWDMGVTES